MELRIFFCIVTLSFLNVYLGVPSLNHIVILFLGLFFLCINHLFIFFKLYFYVWHEAARYPLTLSALFLGTWFWLVISKPQPLPFIGLSYMHGLAVPRFYFGAKI